MKLRGSLIVSENIKLTLFLVELFWIPFIKIKNNERLNVKIKNNFFNLINILVKRLIHIINNAF